jgi:hypothetical protein
MAMLARTFREIAATNNVAGLTKTSVRITALNEKEATDVKKSIIVETIKALKNLFVFLVVSGNCVSDFWVSLGEAYLTKATTRLLISSPFS